jgi:Zn-dependent M28 family amino/carboxypeptidase
MLEINVKTKNSMGILMLGIVLVLTSVTLGVSVSDIVATVDQASYSDYLNDSLYTHTGDNRGLGGTQHDLARNNIQSLFGSFGLQTSLFPFTYGTATYNNVVGVLPGTDPTAGEYIVGAHYDSANNPGADDDASGVAGVLEAANVLSKYQFKSTLVFIAFDREEQGLVGSNAYASAHSGDNILGMVAMDMIAYNLPESDFNHDKALLYGRDSSNPVKQALAGAFSDYGNGVTAIFGGTLDASDHAPFEWNGKQACLLIEPAVRNNPYYHTANDTVDMLNYIDYQYATNMTRATVGYLAESAVIIPEPATLSLLAVGGLALLRKRRA